MKGKPKTTATFLTLFIALEIILATETHAANVTSTENIIIVDKKGGDYQTIQEAINNAPEGSTIFVKAGTYDEILNIKKKITLTGENKDNTIINPISKKNKYAIRLGAPQITIKELSITNGDPGLYTTGIKIAASQTQIQDCKFYDTPIGIKIFTSNNIITNCEFWGCKDEGIALMGTPYSDCENNEITNCIFHDNCDGIELQYSSGNTITNCDFYDNTHTGIDAITSSNDRNIISNCKIYNNEVHGVYLRSSSNNQIIDCTISNNKDGNVIECKNSQNNEIKNSKNEYEENNMREQLLNFLRLFQKRLIKARTMLRTIISYYQNLYF